MTIGVGGVECGYLPPHCSFHLLLKIIKLISTKSCYVDSCVCVHQYGHVHGHACMCAGLHSR